MMKTPPAAGKKATICFVSFSPIADDARVRRHGDVLHDEGWDVVAVGLPGAKSRPPAWRIIDQAPVPVQAEGPVDPEPFSEVPSVSPLHEEAGGEAPVQVEEQVLSVTQESVLETACVDPASPAVPLRKAEFPRPLRFLYWRSRWAAGLLVMRPLRFVYWRSRWAADLGIRRPLRQARNGIASTAKLVRNIPGASAQMMANPASPPGMYRRAVEKRVVKAAKYIELSSLRAAGVTRILPNVSSWREFKPYLRLLRAHIDQEHALKIYWSWPSMQEMYEKARQVDADLWVANDWSTLPIIARITEEKGGTYLYDSHEFATEEYPNNPHWVAFTKPIAKAVEAKYIHASKRRFAVSPGIATALNSLYKLNPPCEVIRNMPLRQDPVFRSTGERIRVLYHGILSPERGLEAAIESIALWRPEFHLTIRGPGSPAYLASLRKLIRKVGVNDRVELAPPVPMIELVRAAKEFDVGFFALPDNSPHNKFALPNKFFEYINSGLALCVTSCPDMADLVQRYDLGVLLPTTNPQDIANVVNGLDREKIDSYKRNSIAASNELCWQVERTKLVQACNETLSFSR